MNEIEKEYNEWKTMISQYHIPRWEELPDFDLYMDQVTSLIDRYLAPLSNQEDPLLTSAMVNNYVKFKLIDAPKKKKYTKVQLAYLIAITILKQVFSLKEIHTGIRLRFSEIGEKAAYNTFCEQFENALHAMISQEEIIINSTSHTQSLDILVNYAAISLASKLFVQKSLELRGKSINYNKR